MKVLLTGATGLLGRHLLPILIDEKHEVRVLVRPGRENALRSPDLTPFLRADKIEIVTGNLKNVSREASNDVVDWMKPVVRGCTAVIHLAALPPWAPEEEMKHVNIFGTRELVHAAKRANIKRFLHFSSAECSDNLVYNVFRDTKKASEKPVRGNNLEWTVFRPAPMYGPGDRRFLGPMIDKIEKASAFDIPGDGSIKLAPVHVEDVAQCVARTLVYGMAVDAVYHMSGPGIGYDDMLKTLGAVIGKEPKIKHASLKFKENILKIRDLLTKDPQKKLALATARNDLRYFLKDHVYPNDDAKQQVGFNPREFQSGVKQACSTAWWKNPPV
ncbi:MAG: NAD-dependent epimerase/dehydratase family protein [Planctomycetes bacterium]|nr:NAD-dependent epimerase/dehydratase family protein [Planctomycetota bacterium]